MIDNIYFEFTPGSSGKVAEAFFIVIIAFFASIIISIYVTRRLFTGRTFFGHLALESSQQKEDGFSVADASYMNINGKTGIAHTMLRPSGKVMIEGEIFDATAITGYIDKGDAIEVVKYETAQLFVRKVK